MLAKPSLLANSLQEDLCLMTVAEDGALRFVSGAVLFPQRWSLAEKLGMDMRWMPCIFTLQHRPVMYGCAVPT